MTVTNKVTIISGAGGGLGQTVSRFFYKAGATVVLVGTRLESVQPVAETLDNNRHLALAANLSNAADADRVVAATLNQFGRVDVVLNLAGGFDGGLSVSDSTNNILPKMLNINLFTAYNLSKAAAIPMIRQKWGRIINIASRDALRGRAMFSAYAMSKAALLRLTESMADELRPRNITVNAILPGAIDTEANRKAMPTANFNKWVKPATIAEAILFLASENTATTGAAIPLYEQIAETKNDR